MYLPISRTCTAGAAIKHSGLREKTYFFDWLGQPYQTVSDILNNGIDRLFEDYEIVYPVDHTLPVIWDKTYNILFIHEADPETMDALDVNQIKTKYIERYNRTIDDLRNAQEVVLIKASTCETSLLDHWKRWEAYFEAEIPDSSVDNMSIGPILESIYKINPNITIKQTENSYWAAVVRELKAGI
jgi:hypothetical protein